MRIIDACFSQSGIIVKLHMFLAFGASTTWVTLLWVVGLAGCAGHRKHWQDQIGEPRFNWRGERPVWVISRRKHGG